MYILYFLGSNLPEYEGLGTVQDSSPEALLEILPC